MGGDEKTKDEKGGAVENVDKASSSTTTTATVEKRADEGEIKEEDTNLIQNRYEVAVKLQDLQADPNSPLYSVKSFEELGL